MDVVLVPLSRERRREYPRRQTVTLTKAAGQLFNEDFDTTPSRMEGGHNVQDIHDWPVTHSSEAGVRVRHRLLAHHCLPDSTRAES